MSQGRVCSLPIGEGAGWSSTHSSRCGTGFGEMQHSLKACSHPGEGGLRDQGVRLDCSNEHTRAHPSVVAKGMSASPSHQSLFPPPYDSHFPPQAHSGQCGSPQAGLSDASLPVAKSQGTSPHRPAPSAIKAGVPEALQPLRLPGKLRSCLTCWFNAFLLADGRWGGGAVHRHNEQTTNTSFVQPRGY
jgi:hypothetical protein